MRWCSLVRTRSVISVIAEIGTASHRPGRKNGVVLDTSALEKFVDGRRQVIHDSVPPSREIVMSVGIE